MPSVMLLAVALAPSLMLSQERLKDATRGVAIEQNLNWELPLDAKFRTDSGEQIQLSAYFNSSRPVIMGLVYYKCPKLCGQVMNGLLSALRLVQFDVGKEFDVVFISIDPKEQPPLAAAKKRGYVAGYGRPGSEAGWHFLTGEESEIKRVADALGFRYNYDASTGLYVHGAAVMVITPQGRISKYFYGLEYSARDIRLAIVEASGERIGSLIDVALLLCLDYDPIEGKYGFVIIPTIRLLAIATILALAVFIVRAAKSDKKKDRDRERREETKELS